jgi:hypothetical protein
MSAFWGRADMRDYSSTAQMLFFVTGDTAWPDERKYVHIKRIVLTN